MQLRAFSRRRHWTPSTCRWLTSEKLKIRRHRVWLAVCSPGSGWLWGVNCKGLEKGCQPVYYRQTVVTGNTKVASAVVGRETQAVTAQRQTERVFICHNSSLPERGNVHQRKLLELMFLSASTPEFKTKIYYTLTSTPICHSAFIPG